MWKNYQDFIDAAVAKFGGKRAGGQSALARAVNELLPEHERVKPQTIQYLQRRSGKPARKSGITHLIAKVAGLEPPGLQAGVPSGAGNGAGPQWSLERTQEVDGVELTNEALLVAKAFMELPGNLRKRYKRKIEADALRYSSDVEDQELAEYAQPGKREAAPKKKRVGGTQ